MLIFQSCHGKRLMLPSLYCSPFSYLGWRISLPHGVHAARKAVISSLTLSLCMNRQIWSELTTCCFVVSVLMHIRYLKDLITFSHDKVGTIGNLSRIDPSLLGVKDANSFNR